MSNKPYYLALNRMPGIGVRYIKKLSERWPDLSILFSLSVTQMVDAGLSPNIASTIAHFDMRKIEEDLRWEKESSNHYLLTYEDDRFPALLREIYDPPCVLYAKGHLDCLNNKRIGIVGSRRPSPSGAETARRFGTELAKAGLTVVSGLAIGIDTQAHAGCLAADGATIAVMGTGIDRIYPHQNQQLAAQIVKKGLILTEFSLNSPASAGHFPQRNRIISGLSLAILVVEAAIKSGSLITARCALEQNRDVMAIPGSILSPQSQGCHHLLQQGATLVTSVDDVLRELSITHPLSDVNVQERLEQPNYPGLQNLGFEITTLEQFMVRSGLSLEEAASSLTTLELQGMIKSVPGGYMRCI